MATPEGLRKGIAEFYDESSGTWEGIWGEHMHHGFYEPGATASAADHRAAQVRMVEEALRFAGVPDGRSEMQGGGRCSGDDGLCEDGCPLPGGNAIPPLASSLAGSILPSSQTGRPSSSLGVSLPPSRQEQRLFRGRSRSRGKFPSSSSASISTTPATWSALFKTPSSNDELHLRFVPPTVNNGVKLAVYEKEDSRDLLHAWECSAVGYVVGLHVSYTPLHAYIRSRWETTAFELHILQNGFFVCKFDSEEDLRRALEGFWTIRGHPMILRKWSPDIRLELDSLKSIPLWVAFHGLPLHLWTKEFIEKLASILGEPLYLDKQTAERRRLTYARACIMISSELELPDYVHYRDLDGSVRAIKVSYQWRPQRCAICLTFGHLDGACKPAETQPKAQVYKVKLSSEPKSLPVCTSNRFDVLQAQCDGEETSNPASSASGEVTQCVPLPKARWVQKDPPVSTEPLIGKLSKEPPHCASPENHTLPLLEPFQIHSLPKGTCRERLDCLPLEDMNMATIRTNGKNKDSHLLGSSDLGTNGIDHLPNQLPFSQLLANENPPLISSQGRRALLVLQSGAPICKQDGSLSKETLPPLQEVVDFGNHGINQSSNFKNIPAIDEVDNLKEASRKSKFPHREEGKNKEVHL